LRIPRDLGGAELAKALRVLGYERTRQEGSHIRLTTTIGGQHHVTVPNHQAVKVGTLRSILKAVGNHHRLELEEVVRRLGI
jgi:predicted RNA binding protein YcfA (HicA-like mRNA interferase family)